MDVSFSRYDLADPAPHLPTADAIVHCALLHEAGKFRGGEGKDPDRFWRVNVEGTETLFKAARAAGCRTAVFLSSRAVYGDNRRNEILHETDQPQPDSLYGKVKLAGEKALQTLCSERFCGTVLRATGIYGLPPGRHDHKWSGLFDSFLSGETPEARCGTEVHGDDLASAVSLVLERRAERHPFEVFNVSDLVLDRRDLLDLVRATMEQGGEPPPRTSVRPGVMDTDKLRRLGWRPGGVDGLKAFVEACCAHS